MFADRAGKRRLESAVQHYLHHTLGVIPNLTPWDGVGELPYYLLETFEFREMRLSDRVMVLAMDRHHQVRPVLASLRDLLSKVRAISRHPAVYVTAALASYERKRLVEQKVPFIVPGNQLYLPDLGVDLREFFRRPAPPRDSKLSPATQATLITALLQSPWQSEWQPASIVSGLGYTPMTLSRVVRELVATGIAALEREGRTRRLRMDRPAAATWELAKPLLRSPVKRRVWALPTTGVRPPGIRLAGMSALAGLSMLADPRWSTYALSPSQWKDMTRTGVEALPGQMPGAYEWQIWHYSPALVPDSETVDPLSLTLSLQDETDERVQLALDELRGRFPW